MRTLFQHVSVFLARLLLSLFFLWNGANIISDWQSRHTMLVAQDVQYAVPLLVFEVLCLLLGSLLLVVGFRGRLGALLLIVFLVPDTLVQADWSWVSGLTWPQIMARADTITHCLKNLGLLGGLLMVLGFGSGGFSVDLFLTGRKKKGEK